jgi:formate hydrogenlyase transcriptional activator
MAARGMTTLESVAPGGSENNHTGIISSGMIDSNDQLPGNHTQPWSDVSGALSSRRAQPATIKLWREEGMLPELTSPETSGGMIGNSPSFQQIVSNINIVAPTDATVLIQGETGTGKELIARAIHNLSGRAKQAFVKVNCAAIPATLLESELFGHERGSFTGACAQKIGRFEAAHNGTIFLDEIGEIPLELQAKLLRAMQDREFERLGGNRTIKVDIRIVAATNRNLQQMAEEGKFRSDLYYRLNVFPLAAPSLRERRDDIPLLVRYFTRKYAVQMSRDIEEIPGESIESLMAYDWPGNIRELQNIIERSVILSFGRALQVAVPAGTKAVPTPASSVPAFNAIEREQILKALTHSGGQVGGALGAAAMLGLPRTTLQARMKKLEIKREYAWRGVTFRPSPAIQS